MTTGKSKATDGALDEVVKRLHWIVDARDDESADLDSICTYAEQALAYLAALSPPTGSPVALLKVAGRLDDEAGFISPRNDTRAAAFLRAQANEIRAILAAPPQVEPVEGEIAGLVERLNSGIWLRRYPQDAPDHLYPSDEPHRAAAVITSQSAELLSLRRKAEETEAALLDFAAWCQERASHIGAVDGYDYRSGEEAAYRHASIEATNRARALAGEQP